MGEAFIVFLGAVSLYFAWDKVTSLQPEQRNGGRYLFNMTRTRSCSQDSRVCCQPRAPPLTTATADMRPVLARAT